MITKKKILISVGTTQFQDLVKYTDSQQFLNILKQIQSEHLKNKNQQLTFQILSQIGPKGQYIPKNNKFIRLSDKINQIYQQSDYIICHGGAGTLLANLYNNKKIISISNDSLAGNHQLELIQKLSKQNYLLGFKNVQQFKQNKEKVKQFFNDKIKFDKYQRAQSNLLNKLIFGQEQQ